MYSVDASSQDVDVWLVKVPKFIANNWKNAPEKTELGKLKRSHDGTFDFTLSQKQEAAKGDATAPEKLPSQYKLRLHPITHQKMVILSKDAIPNPTTSASAPTAAPVSSNDKISFKGEVTLRGELRTSGDINYMNLKTSSIREAARPAMTTQILDKAVTAYKPRGATQLAHEAELRKKKEEAKRTLREDKDIVMNRLYAAFGRQRYYNIKDLVRLTNQPLPYLKEILKEMCVYCSTGTHKNMWELKPEYRHYTD